MVSFEVRRRLETAAKVLIFAAIAASDAALSQPDSLPPAADAQRAVVEAIEEIQAERGINSPDLIDPLTALALFYREHGDNSLATAAIERARQVVSVNYGLHSLAEALLIRQLVQIEEARGNVEGAWKLEQDLLTLLRRHPNDLRTVPILREIADKRMDVLSRYKSGEFPPEIVLGCYYSWQRRSSCHAGSRRDVIGAIYTEAMGYRSQAYAIEQRHANWLASGCARPQVPEIPDGRGLSRRQVRPVKMEVVQYLSSMYDYTSCLQAEYVRAQSTDAAPSELSQLASVNNAAIEEVRELRAVYEKRIGPFVDLDR